MLSRTGWSSIVGIVLVCGLTLVSIRVFEEPVLPGRAVTLTRAPVPPAAKERLAMSESPSMSLITRSTGVLSPVEEIRGNAEPLRVEPLRSVNQVSPFALASSGSSNGGHVFQTSSYQSTGFLIPEPVQPEISQSDVVPDQWQTEVEPVSLAEKMEGPPLRVAEHIASDREEEQFVDPYAEVPYSNLPDPFADPVPEIEATAISQALAIQPRPNPVMPFANSGIDPAVGIDSINSSADLSALFAGLMQGPAGQIRIHDEAIEDAFAPVNPPFEEDSFVNSVVVPTLQVSANLSSSSEPSYDWDPTESGSSADGTTLSGESNQHDVESNQTDVVQQQTFRPLLDAERHSDAIQPTPAESPLFASEVSQPVLREQPPAVEAQIADNSEPVQAVEEQAVVEPVEEAEPAWMVSPTLLGEIEYFRNHELTGSWADSVHQLLDLLSAIDDVGNREAEPIFAQLDARLVQIEDYINKSTAVEGLALEQQQFLARLKKLNYKFQRTLDIWQDVYELAASGYRPGEQQPRNPMLTASARRISFAGIDPSWHEFLLVEEADREFSSLNPDRRRQQQLARRILARITSSALDQQQRSFVLNSYSEEAIELLLDLATGEPDLESIVQLMHDIESKPSGYVDYRLNDVWQSLIWSDDERLHHLAAKINVHYRNANFRMSIHEQLLNRMVPQMPATTEPVSENVMGARVSGQSQIRNRLFVQLVPDPNHIHFNVETDGSVHSDTTASSSGVTVQNQGVARFRVFKRLQIGINGIVSDLPVSWADANQQIVGLRSDYDPIPLVGRIARNIARQKIAEQTPATNEMLEQRVAVEAEEIMQQQVEQQMAGAKQFLQENILQPLVAMDLEPQPFQLATTDELMVARYRIAGYDQMAADTSRPDDLPGALLNLQMHQSTINNLLARQGLNGTRFTIEELAEHLREVFGTSELEVAGDDSDAQFVFAPLDPMRVDLDNGEIVISLNLSDLQVGPRKKWRNLQIKATYIPEVHGTTIVLVQKDPGISLQGGGRRLKLREQLALRTVFRVLFQERYEIGTLNAESLARINSPQLGIAALHLEDGWIGIAFADLVPHQPPVVSPQQIRDYPDSRTTRRPAESDPDRRVIYSNR